jgi:hypothetical protein
MDLDPIIRVGFSLAALVAILAVVRIAIVPDGVGFGDLFVGIRGDMGPAQGVQEEEHVRWRPECLTPRRATSPARPPTPTGTGAATQVGSGRATRAGGLSAARRPR